MCLPVASHFGVGQNLDDLKIDGRRLTADEKTFASKRPGDKLQWGMPITGIKRITDARSAGVLDKSGSLVKKEAPKAAPKAAPKEPTQPVVSSRPSSTAAPKGTGTGKPTLVSGGVDGANVGRKTLLGA